MRALTCVYYPLTVRYKVTCTDCKPIFLCAVAHTAHTALYSAKETMGLEQYAMRTGRTEKGDFVGVLYE